MRKFWTIRPNAGYGVGTKSDRENLPDLPASIGERSYTMPGDIRVAEGAHSHLVHGSVLLPSTEEPDGHYHWLIPKPGGGIKQVYVGDGASHTHTGELVTHNGEQDYVQPKWYVILITCDDAEYINLTDNGVDNYAERVASSEEVDGETVWSYAPLSNATWGAGKRNAIESRLDNALGLELPSIVDTDKEFITWILDFGAWRPEQEDKHG